MTQASRSYLSLSCFYFWLEFHIFFFVCRFWSFLAKPSVLLGGSYKTECVRKAAVFTAFVPGDARLGYRTTLTLYCSPNRKRRNLFDSQSEENNILLEESSWKPLKPNDKAYVFLSEGVVTPVEKEDLKDFYVR